MMRLAILIQLLCISFRVAFSYRVGTGIYDITGPAVEVNFMGYAVPAQRGTGIHLRLRARAFAFEDEDNGKRFCFVSLDGGMGSDLVNMRVVDRLNAELGQDVYTVVQYMSFCCCITVITHDRYQHSLLSIYLSVEHSVYQRHPLPLWSGGIPAVRAVPGHVSGICARDLRRVGHGYHQCYRDGSQTAAEGQGIRGARRPLRSEHQPVPQ